MAGLVCCVGAKAQLVARMHSGDYFWLYSPFDKKTKRTHAQKTRATNVPTTRKGAERACCVTLVCSALYALLACELQVI